MAEPVKNELDVNIDCMQFYTDSRVVLGYINNQTRRFYVYVQRIRKSTKPEQWCYVHTDQNPADLGTRSVPAAEVKHTTWLTGPTFLSMPDGIPNHEEESYELVDPDSDGEVRSHATAITNSPPQLGSYRFEWFSSWKSLVRAIASLSNLVKRKKAAIILDYKAKSPGPCSVEELSEAKTLIIRCVQRETYKKEFDCLAAAKNIPENSSLRKLDPYVDEGGLLRIGGRLKHAALDTDEQFSIIVPTRSHIATLLVRHYQGRVFTERSIRAAGYWIVGAKRCMNNILHKCVTCNKLCGKICIQKMLGTPFYVCGT